MRSEIRSDAAAAKSLLDARLNPRTASPALARFELFGGRVNNFLATHLPPVVSSLLREAGDRLWRRKWVCVREYVCVCVCVCASMSVSVSVSFLVFCFPSLFCSERRGTSCGEKKWVCVCEYVCVHVCVSVYPFFQCFFSVSSVFLSYSVFSPSSLFSVSWFLFLFSVILRCFGWRGVGGWEIKLDLFYLLWTPPPVAI